MSKRIIFSAAVIGLIGFVTYLPALKIQFYDGWWYLLWSATMDLPRFLIQFLDPAYITQGYRPVQGIFMYLLFHFFGFNPDGYHLAQNLLHAANAILVFLLVQRLTKRSRLAFVASIIYAVLPNYSLAIFWNAVVDPLAGFFYLLTLWFWTRFLEKKRARDYIATLVVFVLALLSKEVAVFLPVFMFLIAWWFFHERPSLRVDLPRYLPFLLLFPAYLWQVYQVQSHGEFVSQFGFRIGPHMLNNLIPYLAVLTFPWTVDLPTNPLLFVWLAIVALGFTSVMIFKRSRAMLFLAFFAVLNISPLLGFPLDYFNTRYLYLSTISSAVVLAVVFEWFREFFAARRLPAILVALAIAMLVGISSAQVADSANGLADYTRQTRVPFRDITRLHPEFPPDSYLYFVYSPLTSYWDFEGLFFSRYGNSVKLNATDLGQPANLRDHRNSFVYYFDATGKPIEIPVDPEIALHIAPTLPATFEKGILLESIEVPSARLEQGKALVAILNWRTQSKPDKSYTVFAHLLDAKGNRIAEYDSLPSHGKSPTPQWQIGVTYVDAVVLPISADASLGDGYRLEIGMYDADTFQPLAIIDAAGKPSDDKFVIDSFKIVERQ